MSKIRAVDELLHALVGQHTIVAAVLATSEGELLAVHPTPSDPEEAIETARWATEQIEGLAGLRSQMPQEEFSILFDPKDGRRAHSHVVPVTDHVLVLLLSERDCFGGVRLVAKEAARRLAGLLTVSGHRESRFSDQWSRMRLRGIAAAKRAELPSA